MFFSHFSAFMIASINHNHRAHTSGSDGPEAEVCITKPVIPLRTCHAWQALRKVLLSIFRKIASDTSRIITRTLEALAFAVHQGFCFLSIFVMQGFYAFPIH